MLKAVELEIELFCRGMVIGESYRTNGGRRISRTRAGLGSGLEIVIPARPKDIWVNVPVVEPFAKQSVFSLQNDDDGYFVADSRNAAHYPVRIPEEPAWYSARTTLGVEMSRVGVLQHGSRTIPLGVQAQTGAISRAPRGVNEGKGFVFISHIGDVFPSGFLPLKAGNVRRQSLGDIYRSSDLFTSLRESGNLKGKCGLCEFRDLCGGSRARAWSMTGHVFASDPLCTYMPAGARYAVA